MTIPDPRELGPGALSIPAFPEHPDTLGAAALAGVEPAAGSVDAPSGIQALLSPEQRAFADAVATSMVETLGLQADEIALVVEPTPDGGRRAVAIDASPNGQHIGLYERILQERESDPAWYTIEVGGQRIDPLAGCTRTAYEAMIVAARERGERFLPDSLALNQQNGHVWTATMMTGEPFESKGKIWIGSSSSYNKVNFVGHPINRGGRSFRVRPAVVIGELEA